jgi:hypothetical protein
MKRWTKTAAIRTGGPRAKRIIGAILNRDLRITREMIEQGRAHNCRRCPVALALLAVLPNADVSADYSMITIDDCVRFEVPEEIERFMWRFDHWKRRPGPRRFRITELQRFYCTPKA